MPRDTGDLLRGGGGVCNCRKKRDVRHAPGTRRARASTRGNR